MQVPRRHRRVCPPRVLQDGPLRPDRPHPRGHLPAAPAEPRRTARPHGRPRRCASAASWPSRAPPHGRGQERATAGCMHWRRRPPTAGRLAGSRPPPGPRGNACGGPRAGQPPASLSSSSTRGAIVGGGTKGAGAHAAQGTRAQHSTYAARAAKATGASSRLRTCIDILPRRPCPCALGVESGAQLTLCCACSRADRSVASRTPRRRALRLSRPSPRSSGASGRGPVGVGMLGGAGRPP